MAQINAEVKGDAIMSYLPVIETRITDVKPISAENGRSYHLIGISSPGFASLPGQFVMIQRLDGHFTWSYPYMVYENTPEGLNVLAAENSSLWTAGAGDKIALWGANGKACGLAGTEIFVAEPATAHLIFPLVHCADSQRLIICGGNAELPEELLPPQTSFISDFREIRQLLEGSGETIYMALNLSTLEQILSGAPSDSLAERIMLFVSTQVGCGIGACKACYLHSPDIQTGIPVCCSGPYLPYSRIDLEKDRKCFQVFR